VTITEAKECHVITMVIGTKTARVQRIRSAVPVAAEPLQQTSMITTTVMLTSCVMTPRPSSS